MLLLPFRRLTLYTQLHRDEVYRRLAAVVEPTRWRNPFSRDHKPYEGKISPNGFKILRIIRHRDSFRPVIIGNVRSERVGSAIEVVLRLHVVVAAFMTLWLGAAGVGTVVMAWEELSRGHGTAPAFAPFSLFILGYAMMQ